MRLLTEFAKHILPVLIKPRGTEASPEAPADRGNPPTPSDKSLPRSNSAFRCELAAAEAYPDTRPGTLLAVPGPLGAPSVPEPLAEVVDEVAATPMADLLALVEVGCRRAAQDLGIALTEAGFGTDGVSVDRVVADSVDGPGAVLVAGT